MGVKVEIKCDKCRKISNYDFLTYENDYKDEKGEKWNFDVGVLGSTLCHRCLEKYQKIQYASVKSREAFINDRFWRDK